MDISRSRSRSEGISDNVTAYSDSDFSEQNLQHSDFDNVDESGGEVRYQPTLESENTHIAFYLVNFKRGGAAL